MAIGTAAAIGLGVAGIGSALGARSSSKAAGKAADTSMAVAQQNNALAREIYGKNEGYLGGYVSRGDQAGNAINALLGLGGSSQGGAQAAQMPQQFGGFGGTQSGNPYDAGGWMQMEPRTDNGGYSGSGSIMGAPMFSMNQAQGGGSIFGQTAAPASTPQQDYNKAFENYQNSTGFQFRQQEGNNALNSGYAANGSLRSGAAMKDFARFNQNIASDEFGNYLGQLANQQGVGLSGASAIAGVGQNYVNNVSANNNSAGTAAANAALVKGQNNPFAALAGTVGGFASSYGFGR